MPNGILGRSTIPLTLSLTPLSPPSLSRYFSYVCLHPRSQDEAIKFVSTLKTSQRLRVEREITRSLSKKNNARNTMTKCPLASFETNWVCLKIVSENLSIM
jgi:hypothetical protein